MLKHAETRLKCVDLALAVVKDCKRICNQDYTHPDDHSLPNYEKDFKKEICTDFVFYHKEIWVENLFLLQ